MLRSGYQVGDKSRKDLRRSHASLTGKGDGVLQQLWGEGFCRKG